VGGFFSVIWGAGFYVCYLAQSNSLTQTLMSGVFKTAFKFRLRDAFLCNKTKRRKAIDRGLGKIDDELDVVNFIRFHLQTRSLLKQLFSAEKRKAARDFKSHLNSEQSPASEESSNLEPDPFEHDGVNRTD
jgi:hypothetical protein